MKYLHPSHSPPFRHWRNLLASTLLLCALGIANAASGLVVERARPLPALSDARLTNWLAEHQGQPVIINFWASWCEPCRDEMPLLQRLADRLRPQSVGVITVAVADTADKAADFLWEVSVILPLLHDPAQKTARALSVRTLPTTLILDRRHRIVARGRGAIDWDDKAVDAQLQALLK